MLFLFWGYSEGSQGANYLHQLFKTKLGDLVQPYFNLLYLCRHVELRTWASWGSLSWRTRERGIDVTNMV
jgi:hypothetical protein